jgi:hypothetical protein
MLTFSAMMALSWDYSDTLLEHRVAVPDGNGLILFGLVVNRDAVGGADGILAAVALSDRILLIILAVEVEFQAVDDPSRDIRVARPSLPAEYGQFHRGKH